MSPVVKRSGIKLPKIVNNAKSNLKVRDVSPMSQNEGQENSMLSYKLRAVPKRKRSKENRKSVISPTTRNNSNEPDESRMSTLISSHHLLQDDIGESPKRRKSKKRPTGRNKLPKLLHQSMALPERGASKKKEKSPREKSARNSSTKKPKLLSRRIDKEVVEQVQQP